MNDGTGALISKLVPRMIYWCGLNDKLIVTDEMNFTINRVRKEYYLK